MAFVIAKMAVAKPQRILFESGCGNAKARRLSEGIKGGGSCWLVTSVFGAPRDLLELLTLSGLGLELSDLTGLELCLEAAQVYLLIT